MSADPFEPRDIQLLESLKDGNRWLRGVLCTLARRGVALRRASPERGTAILDALATLPYYKGGQFLFDLLEIEDFMLDGPPPEILPTTLDAGSLQRLAAALRGVKRSLAGEGPVEETIGVAIEAGFANADLPPLEAGFYLYQDVVLGIWASVSEPGAGN
jgi:hypothetical protein